MIKRKIWCNMCIDLVTFTYEIFKGALFRSLDGIIISANCKLRKVFTLKFKPQDTAEEDGVFQLLSSLNHNCTCTCIVTPGKYEASDDIPPTCQLNCDVPQVTQVLDLNEIHKPKIKCRENALQETEIMSFKVTKTLGSKTSCQLQNSGMPTETIPEVERLELPLWPCNDTLDQGDKRSTLQITANEYQNAQNASVEHHSRKAADQQRSKKEVFTFSSKPRSAPYGKSPNISPESYIFPLELELDSSGEHEQSRTEDSFEGTDSSEEDDNSELIQSTENIENSHSRQGTSDSAVFKEIPLNKMSQRNEYSKNKEHSKYNVEEAILSKPQSFTTRKTESISFPRTLKPVRCLSPIQSKSKSFREYDRKKYQSNRLSSSELQMLASMKRQQNEELWDAGISHGLSATQIDCCNVNLNIGDDDTATWNSCFPPPISQEHHYQKEMSPLSHSSPR
ncbi:Uncharacterized protein C3orf67 [Lonchura striata]|uniref:Uncharacterized protein C3orf67 n=1 Tax=Lonchura striata TaxID=40157 RepID=A0A218VCC9_9PASE|nr:Uncharacterized protein C3orf67 [Lonchura striata domestica]